MASLAEYLQKGDYTSEMSRIISEGPTASKLSRCFNNVMVSRHRHLYRLAPRSAGEIFRAYSYRYVVENLKRIMRAKQRKTPLDRDLLIPFQPDTGKVDLATLMSAPALQDVLEALEKTPFRGISQLVPAYQKYGLISILESYLDRVYFQRTLGQVLKGTPDRRSVRNTIGIEGDLSLLNLILDLRSRDVSPDVVQSLTFTGVRLQPEEIIQMSRAKVEAIPDLLTKTFYGTLADRLDSAILTRHEENLQRLILNEIYRRIKWQMIRYPNTLGYVFGFLYLAEAEAKNLIAIVTGKELGLDENRLVAVLQA